jgi:hypothetical protein
MHLLIFEAILPPSYASADGQGFICSSAISIALRQLEFLAEQRGNAQMFVTVTTYRAKLGEEDAIIALHEDWQRNQSYKTKVHLSWELLRNIKVPGEFIAIAHFQSKELAQAAITALEQDAWYCRLLSLIEEEPVYTDCRSEWRIPDTLDTLPD